MPSVVISFSDGEVLHAETPELTFDQQVLEAEPRSVEPNTERALFPLTAIRMMVVGEPRAGPDETVVGGWDRAAFHFTDGHVLRASIQPSIAFEPCYSSVTQPSEALFTFLMYL